MLLSNAPVLLIRITHLLSWLPCMSIPGIPGTNNDVFWLYFSIPPIMISICHIIPTLDTCRYWPWIPKRRHTLQLLIFRGYKLRARHLQQLVWTFLVLGHGSNKGCDTHPGQTDNAFQRTHDLQLLICVFARIMFNNRFLFLCIMPLLRTFNCIGTSAILGDVFCSRHLNTVESGTARPSDPISGNCSFIGQSNQTCLIVAGFEACVSRFIGIGVNCSGL